MARNTLDRRHTAATTRASAALAAFTEAADTLISTAEELEAVAGEAYSVADAHRNRAKAAETQAVTNRDRAARIREMVG